MIGVNFYNRGFNGDDLTYDKFFRGLSFLLEDHLHKRYFTKNKFGTNYKVSLAYLYMHSWMDAFPDLMKFADSVGLMLVSSTRSPANTFNVAQSNQENFATSLYPSASLAAPGCATFVYGSEVTFDQYDDDDGFIASAYVVGVAALVLGEYDLNLPQLKQKLAQMSHKNYVKLKGSWLTRYNLLHFSPEVF